MRTHRLAPGVFLLMLLSGCPDQVASPDSSLDSVAPQAICNAQLTTPVTVNGSGFTPLPVGTLTGTPSIALPKVSVQLRTRADSSAGPLTDIYVPDDAQPPNNHVRWNSPQQMSFDIFPSLAATQPDGPNLAPGLYDVTVQNADTRRATAQSSLAIVPPPTLQKTVPTPLCDAQGDTSFTLTGTGFVQLNGQLPTVRFTDPAGKVAPLEISAAAVSDCANPPVPNGVTLLSCKTLTVKLARGGLPAGVYQVAVHNPKETGCLSQEDVRILIVQPPTLQTAVPSPVCDAQGDVAFTLTGTGFIQLNGQLPTVRFTAPDAQMPAAELSASAVSGCTQIMDPNGAMVNSCTGLTVTVPMGTLPAGSYRVAVHNPKDTGCVSQEDVRIVAVPPPMISQMTTPAVCAAQDSMLTLMGSSFLIITDDSGMHGPQVTIDGMPFAGTAQDCQPVTDAPNAQICDMLVVTIPKGSLAFGPHSLSVQNPAPAACMLPMTLTLQSVPPPTLTGVKPSVLCAGGGTLTLTGTAFRDGATVLINNVPSAKVTVSGDGTSATALFAGVIKAGGPYDITFRNIDGCQSTLAKQITVTPGPSILFVDPPSIPNTISTQVTVYGSGVTPPVVSVQITPAGGMSYTKLSFTTNPAFPNRVQAIVPAGLAAGSYDMILTDSAAGHCPAFLPGAIKVVATPTLTVSSVVPGFGSTANDTAVIVSGAGFVSIPRIYLNPTGNPPGSLATSIAAVTYQSNTSLTGVVRSGLPAGTYDVLVVNPDGSFGILSKGYIETPMNAPPPVVTSIAPSSYVTGASTAATIYGTGFRSPSVTLNCQDAAGNAVTGASASITSSTSTSIGLNITATGVLCIVRVTNQDGTYFDYSAIGVTNASLNLNGFTSGTPLTTSRRGLGASAGRPTAVARFVYAVGGDNGTDSMPLSTVETAPTGLDGTLRNWFVLSKKLPAARSFIGLANVGRFLYAVGGFDGQNAQTSVYRSELLNPLAAPQITDVNVIYDDYQGIAPGQYIYRVSAVLSNADPNNPGGETLAGDFFPVRLPKIDAGQLQLTLIWSTVPNAAQYKIYRSPNPNDPAGSELLLATVPATASPLLYVDKGNVKPAGAAPLPLGSTGTWRVLPSLLKARIGAGVAAVPDPKDMTKWYLYAAGGNSGTLAAPTPLSSVESLTLTLDSLGNQTFGTWQDTGKALPAAVWLAPALPATPGNNSLITAGTAYLYVGSGSTSSITTANKPLYVAQVMTGGALTSFANSGSVGVGRTGYGGIIVNNEVQAFGGFQAGAAVTNSDSASLSTATNLKNFNSLGGGVLTLPRALQGTALESAFIYQLGGANAGPNTAQSTTEQTVW